MLEMARWFKALSEDIRVKIVALLFRHGELCVCEVERLLEVSQSSASRHLQYLRNAALVEDRRDEQWVYYRLAEPRDESHRILLEALEALLVNAPVPDVGEELDAMRAERCAESSTRSFVASAGGAPAAGAASGVREGKR
jgi:ArsR family transcriptional regulator, arsenate/arsenite/antimonite-responsive transcriptional repressor